MTDLRGDATDEQLGAVGQLVDDHVQLVESDLLQAMNDVAPGRLRRWPASGRRPSRRRRASQPAD